MMCLFRTLIGDELEAVYNKQSKQSFSKWMITSISVKQLPIPFQRDANSKTVIVIDNEIRDPNLNLGRNGLLCTSG